MSFASRYRYTNIGVLLVSLLPLSTCAVNWQETESGWLEAHKSWTSAPTATIFHDSAASVCVSGPNNAILGIVHPVCLDSTSCENDVDGISCVTEESTHRTLEERGTAASLKCLGVATPSDAEGSYYLPLPWEYESTGTGAVCASPTNTFNHINPLNGLHYSIGPLTVTGSVFGLTSTEHCEAIPGALFEIWQADPYGWYDSLTPTALADADEKSVPPSIPCRSSIRTDAVTGTYSFTTATPGAYGPPQHINIRVSAPGHITLVTRLYFSQDPLLKLESKERILTTLPYDPRVLTPASDGSVSFNVVLAPIEGEGTLPYDISGTWMVEGEGRGAGALRVESDGAKVIITEIPTPRTFGTTTATLYGNSAITLNNGSSALLALGTYSIEPVTGVIEVEKALDGSHEAVAVVWSNGAGQWRKGDQSLRYRYVKLTVTATLRTAPGGYVTINELQIFELQEGGMGSLSLPLPTTPLPQSSATSTSYSDGMPPEDAFDGKLEGSDGGWRTADAGRGSSGVLLSSQSLVVDLGVKGGGVVPAAIKILCSPDFEDDSGLRECPKAWTLEGSNDGITFATLASRSELTLTDYPHGWGIFQHINGGGEGRSEGDRCGSCDVPPYFNCAIDAFDSSCETGVCGVDGTCASTLVCALGQMLYGTSATSFSCRDCPAGVYDKVGATSRCNGICPEGYFCPPASTDPHARECGDGLYCPQGSGVPLPLPGGMIPDATDFGSIDVCPPGHSCTDGVAIPCPAGTFSGTSTSAYGGGCTDSCVKGEYCPDGTIEPSQCWPGNYCPDGKVQLPCPAGTYGATEGLTSILCSGECPVGRFCPAGTSNPWANLCAGGTFGSVVGATTNQCEGPCPTGYYCPAGSSDPYLYKCSDLGAAVYCPQGSEAPRTVSTGYYSVNGESQVECPSGSYCSLGIRYLCPAGWYGHSKGLHSDNLSGDGHTCDGLCSEGYYCPAGSTTPEASPCPPGTYNSLKEGKSVSACSTCPIGSWCPAASINPIPCAAGLAGSSTGLQTAECSPLCSLTLPADPAPGVTCEPNYCAEGYYCPINSTTEEEIECGGDNVYCPKGSSAPLAVGAGYYTTGGGQRTHTGRLLCERGNYCTGDGLQRKCPAGVSGDDVGLTSKVCAGGCPPGEYCTFGSIKGTVCPPGFYGDPLVSLTASVCSGLCAAGFFCPAGTTSSQAFECGGDEVFCPAGSAVPTQVTPGYYSVGPTSQTRTGQVICPLGSYCVSGVKYLCPSGTYGESTGLSSASCSGLCARGHFCVAGSISVTQTACPFGTFGESLGLGSSSCSGNCGPTFRCEPGSVSARGVRFSDVYSSVS